MTRVHLKGGYMNHLKEEMGKRLRGGGEKE